MVSVVTETPLSRLKYRLAPTTPAPAMTTARVIRMFFPDIDSSSVRYERAALDSGNGRDNHEVNDEHGRGDRRRAPLVEHAQADGRRKNRPST